MDDKAHRGWLMMGIEAWSLGAEASFVAGLRLAGMATGRVDAATEARRMVGEKVVAALELKAKAASGRLGATPLAARCGTTGARLPPTVSG